MESAFVKRRGTTDRGKQYEEYVLANLILKLITDDDIEDFLLSSNDYTFYDFDDIVLTTKHHNGTTQTYALQLKHSHSGKGLTKNSLASEKGNFSIIKYFKSFLELTEHDAVTDKLIVFTNFKFEANNEIISLSDETNILISQYQQELLIKSSEAGCCYQFCVTKDHESSKYTKFFQKFYLYTNQADVYKIEKDNLKKFQTMFSCDVNTYQNYLNFLSKWSGEEGKKEKLNKTWIKNAIAIQLLLPYVMPLFHSETAANDKTKVFRKIVSKFDITIFEEDNRNRVKIIWGDAKNNVRFDSHDVKHTVRKYQISLLNDHMRLDDKETAVLLWLINQCPLIVTGSETAYKAIQVSANKNFVVLDNDFPNRSFYNSVTFQTLSDCERETDVYEEVLETFECSLQGKKKMPLKTLVALSEQMTSAITTDHLLNMLDNPFIIGEEREKLPDSHFERFLTRSIVNYQFLEKVDNDILIAISGLKDVQQMRNRFGAFSIININEFSKNDKKHREKSKNVKRIYFTEDECSQEQFDFLCGQKDSKCHQLRFVEEVGLEGFEWIRSKGGISEIKEFLLTDQYYVDESNLSIYEKDNNVNLICAKPGMGKTTLFKSLKNNSSPTSWTVLIYVRNHTKHFREKGDNLYEFEKYILDENRKNHKSIDSKVLKILMEKRQVIYLWDGLDEVSDEILEVINSIIQQLSKKTSIQWISARNNLKKELETKFNVISRTVKPFNELEQMSYIKSRLRCSDDELDNIFAKVKNNINIFSNNDVLGIPFQIYILTELFLHDAEKYSTLLKDVFSVADLYEHFVDEKFSNHYQAKEAFDPTNEFISVLIVNYKMSKLDYYKKSAIRIYFDTEIASKSNKFTVIHEKDPVGFITNVSDDDCPEFFHNSFGEYFAALYLSEDHEVISGLQKCIFEDKNNNIRFFLDLILAKNCRAHIAVLYKNLSLLMKCTDKDLLCKDEGGRNPLQLACSWGTKYPLLKVNKTSDRLKIDDRAFFKLSKSEHREYQDILVYLSDKYDPKEIDVLFNLDSLEYAFNSGCLLSLVSVASRTNKKLCYPEEIICTLLYHSVRFDYSCTFDIIENIPLIESVKYRRSLLYLAVSCNAVNCLQKMLTNKLHRDKTSQEPLLHKACENGNWEIVQLLIDNGADVNYLDDGGKIPLHYACTYGNYQIAKLLIQKESQVNLANKFGWLPIHQACINGHVDIVELLIGNKADTQKPDKYGKMPIHLASTKGRVNIVKLLIKMDTNVDVVTTDGRTPIHFACENGHEEVVKLLVEHKRSLVQAVDKKGQMPIHLACAGGFLNIIQIIANSGASLESRDAEEKTPMHYACAEGYYHIVKFLTDRNSSTQLPDKTGKMPLHYACVGGFNDIVQLLITINANVNIPDNKGITPVRLACTNKRREIVKLLIDNGADVTSSDRDGKSLIHHVCENGDLEIVQHLLTMKVNLEVESRNGKMPMHYVSTNGHFKIAELLLENGVNINVKDKYQKSPLHYACQRGHYKIAELLIDNKVETEVADEDGELPIYYAYREGHYDILVLLVENGVDLEVADKEGKMLIHRACADGRLDVLELLIDNDANLELHDEEGETPIHHASAKGHYDIVKLLIDNGVPVDVQDQYGKRPIDRARLGGYTRVVELLEDGPICF